MTSQQDGIRNWSSHHSEYEEAAIAILSRSNQPLSMNELIHEMLSQQLVTVRGKTPERSLYSILLRRDKKRIERGEKPVFNKIRIGSNIKLTINT